MQDREWLKQEMGIISGEIARNKVLGLPVGKLRARFGRLSMQYKRYWLRDRRKNEKEKMSSL